MGPLGGFWEIGEERACDGSFKRVEIEKWLNDGKNKR